MRKKPERLQDLDIARTFRADYEELLGRQIRDDQFLEFYEHAHEQAAQSVLAASVFIQMRHYIAEYAYTEALPPRKRQILKLGAKVAGQVEELDSFLRDETVTDELILFTSDTFKGMLERGRSTDIYLTVSNDSWIQHNASEGRANQEDDYFITPVMDQGVNVMHSGMGRGGTWLQGSLGYFSHRNKQGYNNFFGQGFSLSYMDLSRNTTWPPGDYLPALTIGRAAVMELFENQLESDLTVGFTQNRFNRPSFTLFRAACYIDDPQVSEMRQKLEHHGIFKSWRQQMLDEQAISIVTGIAQMKERKATLNSENAGLFFFDMSISHLEAEWLDLTESQLVERIKAHAARLGVEATQEEIEFGLIHKCLVKRPSEEY